MIGALGLSVLPALQVAAAVGATATPALVATAGAASLAPAGDAFVPLKSATLASDIWAKAGAPAVVTVRGRGGVPISGAAGAGVAAVVLEVQVSDAPSAGQLVAYSVASTRPGAVSVSYPRATEVSQLVVVPLGTGRQVDLAVSAGKAKVAVAVTGYYAEPGTTKVGEGFVSVTPARIASVGPLKPHVTGLVRVTGTGAVPSSGVGAVAVEVSAVDPAAAGALTVYPAGSANPSVSSVAFARGVSSTGLVVVPPGSGGKIAITDSGGAARVTVDVLGYDPVTGHDASVFVPVRATQIADGTVGKPAEVKVTGTSVIPAAGAKTVLLAVTASGATRAATVTAYQAGTKEPAVTSLSVGKGGTATGLIPVGPGSGGKVALAISAGSAKLAVDEIGYYRADATVPPVRDLLVASRTPWSTALSWIAPATGGDIVIRRAAGSTPPATIASGTAVATLPAGALGYVVTGLQPSTTYSYAVFATDSIGAAAKAATAIAATPVEPGPCTDGFIGAASSAWGNPANWSTGKLPAAAGWVCIPAGAQHLPATTGSSPITVEGFTNQGGLTINASQDGTYADELTATDAAKISTSSGNLTVEGSLDAAGPVEVAGTLTLITGQLTVPGTLTIEPSGSLEAPAQPDEDAGNLPAQIAAGTLVNNGTATIDLQTQINVLSGASFTNGGPMALGAGAGFDVVSGGSFTSTEALSGAGLFDDEGTVTLSKASTLSALTVADGGTLVLGEGTAVQATSTSLAGGTLTLDGTAEGYFGELVTGGTVDLSHTALDLDATGYDSVCGATVTALSADSVTSTFASVTFAPVTVPGTENWLPESTAATAGATRSC